jgi:simple sugar transport system permease protein
MNAAEFADFIAATVRVATPLILAAQAVLILERAGIFGLAIEGVMLGGAFCTVLGAAATGNPWLAACAGIAGGVAIGLVQGVLCIGLSNNQILVAIALNLTILGATSFLQRIVFGDNDAMLRVPGFEAFAIPVLSAIPIIGRGLFDQPALTYITILLVPIISVILYRTDWGLVLRSTGESPVAVDTVGISVTRVRYAASALFGVLGGLSGAVLVLQQVRTFTENMTAGRGFIALVSVIFGRWDPLASLGAATLFGAAEATQTRVQLWTLPISSYFILMLPYVLALLALLGFGGRARYPTAIGRSYDRGER